METDWTNIRLLVLNKTRSQAWAQAWNLINKTLSYHTKNRVAVNAKEEIRDQIDQTFENIYLTVEKIWDED